MIKFLLSIFILTNMLPIFAASSHCSSEIKGYKIVKNTVFPFTVDKQKACFFAFYTTNPEPTMDVKGNGNMKDSIWYGYYYLNNPNKINLFPKPSDTYWSNICIIEAVSFYPMHSNKKPDVTIIGSCDQNLMHYTFPLVFMRQGDQYVLDHDVYSSLYGFIGLTVADVRNYIKSPDTHYTYLRDRYTKD